jgi:RimJ/RimL family protein N-acetyltransferase
MIPPLQPGVAPARSDVPTIETARLILRNWSLEDVAPYTAMLSDPGTARFITHDCKPVTNEIIGWANAAIMAGHWALYGAGMWVIQEKSSGKFAGRSGPWLRPFSPGVDVGCALAKEFRGKGYAFEAMRASIDWTFATFDIDHVIHCLDRENKGAEVMLRRIGAQIQNEMQLLGHPADLWITKRSAWFERGRADATRLARLEPLAVALVTRRIDGGAYSSREG